MIRESRGHKNKFDKINELLEKEYYWEGGEEGNGEYWNDLRQTINKQTSSYKTEKAKKAKMGAQREYDDFLTNFNLDVMEEITRLKSAIWNKNIKTIERK